MAELIWQFDPQQDNQRRDPRSAREALDRLSEGNAAYAAFTAQAAAGAAGYQEVVPVSAKELGLPRAGETVPEQKPFVAFVGCADARVPLETIFGLGANSAFVVRVAGNSLGGAALGSLEYAVANLSSLRLLAVVGHTGCGAIMAAVDAFLQPSAYPQIAATLPLRAVVDGLLPAVQAAAEALAAVYGIRVRERTGYRTAVINLAVPLNAAFTARFAADQFGAGPAATLETAFAVFNLADRRVGLPAAADGEAWQTGLFSPPEGEEGLREFGRRLADAPAIRACLR